MKRLLLLFVFLMKLPTHFLYGEDVAIAPTPPAEVALSTPMKKEPPSLPSDGYTINYNTISIVEYIRFASKICNVNFIFNEEELNFTVTVLSEGPITPENVMSTLLQILRIHGMQLLEQDNNLVIHKSDDVKQMARLVTENGQAGKSAIVTRILHDPAFMLRNEASEERDWDATLLLKKLFRLEDM